MFQRAINSDCYKGSCRGEKRRQENLAEARAAEFVSGYFPVLLADLMLEVTTERQDDPGVQESPGV